MKDSKAINRKRAKREQRGLISEFAFEREQQEGRAGEFLFRRSSCFLVAGKLSDKGPIEGWGWGVRKSKSAVEHPATAPLVRISTTFFMN
ncbi:hypothetical protein F2Q68_00035707 [Brassica cretica]|uniref:Uncharacterized protein n=1 Tax=Brassica cretica TaxID=69181 RepID=A0A8S9H228_BRACR|nr:hypothetical protein F2Q68_00035707 [Brassica cretica]